MKQKKRISLPRYGTPSGRFNFYLPQDIHAEFARQCAERGISASARLAELIARDIGKIDFELTYSNPPKE